MADVKNVTSCQNYPPIMRDLFIVKDTEDYLNQTPDGAVRDALVRRRTYPAAKLLGAKKYRGWARRKLATLSGLKTALDTEIKADPKELKAYQSYAKLLTVSRDNTDLLAAFTNLDRNNPTDTPQTKIIRARLIVEDLEQYLKAQNPDADIDKQLKNLRRSKLVLARKIRRDRKLRAMYQKIARNLFVRNSNIDVKTILCDPDPCESYCPAISSVTPQQVKPGQETTLVIKGRNFPKNPNISLFPEQGIQILKVKRTSAENVEIKIKVGPKAATGKIGIEISSWGKLLVAKSTFEILDPCAKTTGIFRSACCKNNPEATSCKKGGE